MISATDVKTTFAGDGTNDVRNTSFAVFDANDVVIYKLDNATSPPVETLLVNGVDYTLAEILPPLPITVSITPEEVIPNGTDWVAYRSSAFTQDTDWVNAETFPSAAHENAADRAVILSQDLDFHRLRSLRTDLLDTDQDMILPRKDIRKDKIAAYGAVNGEPIAVLKSDIDITSVTMTVDGQAVIEAANFAAMRGPSVLNVIENGGLADKIDAGTLAARPTPGAFGEGIYFATDTRQTYVSDGATWTIVGIDQDTIGNRPAAAKADRLFLSTDTKRLFRDNGSSWDLIESGLTPRYAEGLELEKTGDDQLTVHPGLCQSINAAAGTTVKLELTSPLAKEVDQDWTAGDTGGGKGTGTTYAQGLYRVYVVGQDDGTTTIGIDTATNASNLRTTVAAVAGGTWDHYRQIGWIYIESTPDIADFIMRDDVVLYKDQTNQWESDSDLDGDIDWRNPGRIITLDRCPPDVFGLFRAFVDDLTQGDGFLLTHMYETNDDIDSDIPVAAGSRPPNFQSNDQFEDAADVTIWVDSNRQIRGRTDIDASNRFGIVVRGYQHDRFRIPHF